MKTKLYISLFSIYILTVFLTSCSSMKETDNYYGYNNKPTISDNSTTVGSAYNSSSVDNPTKTNDYSNYVSQNPQNERTTVVENYYFYHPLTYSGYYPWWAPPRYNLVYAPFYSSFYFSYGYDYYNDWYYFSRYRPYNYAVIYYPYPVYYPHPYYNPYYYHHHPGWYPEHKHTTNKPRQDSYRDFGPSRGTYSNVGATNESNQPANRRSSTESVPSSHTGSKTIFQNEPKDKNVRSSARPTPDAFNTPRNERSRDNIYDREIKQSDNPNSDTKYENSQKGEQPAPPTRRTISEPAPDRPNSAPSRDRFTPTRNEQPRQSDPPSRSSNNDSKPAQNNNNQEPANKRSR